jgi:hypothetical protein
MRTLMGWYGDNSHNQVHLFDDTSMHIFGAALAGQDLFAAKPQQISKFADAYQTNPDQPDRAVARSKQSLTWPGS